jgi:nucleoside-diphosphate-sugar epimerase
MAFSGDFAGAANADRRAIETFGEALAGTDKPFVIASGILGVLGVPNGVVATESDGLAAHALKRQSPMPGGEIRMANADFTLALAERGVRSSIVRLAPSTHGDGDNGFIPTAIAFARQKGAAAYVGAGTNRWPTVHRNDAARLFRLAFESAPAGSVLHAVAEQGVPIREIAEAFAEGLDISAVSVAPEQAAEYVGFLGGFWGVDGPASAQITRDLLGWEPTRPGLIADLKEGHYFD